MSPGVSAPRSTRDSVASTNSSDSRGQCNSAEQLYFYHPSIFWDRHWGRGLGAGPCRFDEASGRSRNYRPSEAHLFRDKEMILTCIRHALDGKSQFTPEWRGLRPGRGAFATEGQEGGQAATLTSNVPASHADARSEPWQCRQRKRAFGGIPKALDLSWCARRDSNPWPFGS